jgi:hypothetical protein
MMRTIFMVISSVYQISQEIYSEVSILCFQQEITNYNNSQNSTVHEFNLRIPGLVEANGLELLNNVPDHCPESSRSTYRVNASV